MSKRGDQLHMDNTRGKYTPPWHAQEHSTENTTHHTEEGLLHLLTIKQRTDEHVLEKSNFC